MELVRQEQHLLKAISGRLQPPRTQTTVALFDEVGDTTSLILGVPGWEEVLVFNFREMEDLYQTALRCRIDFILLSVEKELQRAISLVRQMDCHMALSIIPTIIYHRNASREEIKTGLQSAADDFVWGEWDGELFQLRVRMIHDRSNRDIGLNPTSQLPGPILIEQEITRRLTAKEEFAICYLDIDDFKAYNDYRGYVYGDRVIRLVAHIIRDVVSDLSPESFVGHIGGDDFIFLLPIERVDMICSNIVKTFDRIIPYRYDEDDRERGEVITINRKGLKETFGLLTISIAVLINNGCFNHLGEMSHMLADLKSYTKSLHGSNYMIERRKKY